MSRLAFTNADYQAAFLKKLPQYEQYTSKGTKSLFDAQGFLDTALSDITALNEIFGALNRVVLNLINVATVKDPFGLSDFGETYTSEFAAGVQRMAISPMKPTSPRFRNIPASGVNQQAFRAPKVEDRYFKVNFDFQNYYTISEFQLKQMFVSEFGISEFYSGFMALMQNSYTEQKFINVKEAINAGINDTSDALQDTQVVTLNSFGDTPSADELKDFIVQVKNVVSNMQATSSTSAYNQLGFKTSQDVSRLRLLCRVGIKNLIDSEIMLGAYNPDRLSLPFDIIEVEDFGGLKPYADDAFTTPVYPVYDAETGEQIGWNTTENATTATLEDADIYWEDPNASVLALLVDKGIVFHIMHNEPRLIPAPYNAAGLYLTNWFSAPGNEIHWDKLYTCVEFKKPTS